PIWPGSPCSERARRTQRTQRPGSALPGHSVAHPLVAAGQRWHSGSMCGRYASFREAQALADAFDVEEITELARELPASYNVAPTEGVRIVVDRVPKDRKAPAVGTAAPPATARRELHVARWGLVPP